MCVCVYPGLKNLVANALSRESGVASSCDSKGFGEDSGSGPRVLCESVV